MDQLTVFSDQNGSNSKDGDDAFLPNFYPNHINGFNYHVPSPDLSFMDSPFLPPSPEPASFPPSVSVSSGEIFSGREGDSSSPSNDSESSDPVLKYITQILMEENMENLPWEHQNPYALQDTEQSLYQALGDQHQYQYQYPPPVNQPQQLYLDQIVESPDSLLSGSVSNENGSNSHSNPSPATSSGTENLWTNDAEDFNVSQFQVPLPSNSSQVAPNFRLDSNHSTSAPSDISNEQMVQNMMNNVESILQFQRGFEEGNKFLPIIDLQSGAFGSTNQKASGISNAVVKEDNNGSQQSPDGSRGRKNHDREDEDLEEERSTKQSAVYVEESEQLSEMFDKVLLLCKPEENGAGECEGSKTMETSEQPNGGKARSKKREKKKETVDLRTLLILCAQAVSNFDQRTAGELLKQIREHSSSTGDASQRLAHYFANGLEARLEGTAGRVHNFFSSLACQKMTAADILKAYKAHLTACPFKKLSIVFANKTICNLAEKTKAKVLHIVDFGILFGFQWPILIQLLSMRKDGPPKLRITGIEHPQRGFRPAERIEETGRRLAKYCDRFNVPFEYNAIAVQHWEKIKLEDLKIDNENEILAVNNFFRFESLLEETAGVDCPRNAVLNLIRSMNPNIVVHMVVNGAYNAPFFLTRFREALFHFSAIYDVFDTTISRDDPERLLLEGEFYGREAMNVVACEGAERVQRAETYKQWHQRYARAGFKPLPLDPELMEILRGKLKKYYHKDFVIDEDGHWVMQGWKGRILYAASCWVPEEHHGSND